MTKHVGNCRIVREIGTGGMSVVYEAVQESLGRKVAVKMLRSAALQDTEFSQRFEREAMFMASLQHENILHLYDFFRDDNVPWMVLEYVEGIDLYDLLERHPVVAPEVAAIVALQVARALDYAHFRGIIHRDIKPANVMISRFGEVKLMDFGIARDDAMSDLTESGMGVGTPSYMSPEQILGDKLDARSDIFSLGIVLYQMVTGHKPFVEDPQRTVMQKIRLDQPPSPRKLSPSVPRALDRVVMRCLEKMPANRYPSAQALMDDLVEFLSPRVHMNHNARLVLFLRERGIISSSQADEVLVAGLLRATGRTSAVDRAFVRHMVAAQTGFLMLVVLAAVWVQAGLAQRHGKSAVTTVSANQIVKYPDKPGYLKVVVRPWGFVEIDGQPFGYTPREAPASLFEGKHVVRVKNPQYYDVVQEVVVTPHQTTSVVIDFDASGVSRTDVSRSR
jgi:tRNA A-37 threonylcarbamoyl transferase component Bud32